MTDYKRTSLNETIVIRNLITMYYFEFGKHYVFSGERHDFWEILYVDKGEVEVLTDTERHILKQGTIIFHKPNEFHSFYAHKEKAPNLIVLTFDCDSEAMKHFENRVMALGDSERNLLAQIVKEGTEAFYFPFSYPLFANRRSDARIGSEQLIKLYLETLLIQLLRKNDDELTKPALSSSSREKENHSITQRVIQLLEEHIDGNLTLEDISESLHIAKTRLKEIFKNGTGYSIMEYFARLKIEKAKELIREESCSMTEIAARLGFSSVHYFSKAYKKATGMSPTEYSRTVRARM
ncbi:helix-turn-helix domain-containing protein [Paenibacillus sp. NPDC056579]|uniref:AraC family transcriptional regulator n=1 Tax=unclassified Paenibacillus TaxID=185978 RepID=UPI001EF94D8A|nr:AraC family transcriptional regulator [Paenibacillus sp. H1-7]ULL14427.1 AraC family transcriptional regulator [Paenibacillus sp. H1-7]